MPFFVKRNGQAVPIVSDPNVINDTTASQNTAYSGSKVDNLIADHTHASNKITTMTGYSKPSSTSSITQSDSLNAAIGKVEKGLEEKQSPLSLGQYSGLEREIQVSDNKETGQIWYNTGVIDIEPSSSEGKLTISKVDDSVFPEGSAPYATEDIDIPGWEKVDNSPITTTATGTDLTLSTAESGVNTLTIYGKSEVVDGTITSAGEGWSTVDLGTLTWSRSTTYTNLFFYASIPTAETNGNGVIAQFQKITNRTAGDFGATAQDNQFCYANSTAIAQLLIRCDEYTDAAAFKSAMSGVILTYQLADPTQGNTIAVKTDDGTGVDGTMWTFTTGTPLRGIPDTTVRDSAVCDGQTGEVTKMCAEVDLGTLNWAYNTSQSTPVFTSVFPLPVNITTYYQTLPMLSDRYTPAAWATTVSKPDMYGFVMAIPNNGLAITDNNYTDPADFKAAMSGVMLVYELATPTTETMTSTEIQNFNDLRTYEPQTHITNNAGAEMTASAYAGTDNGKAVQELEDKVQSEISELKITQSDTLTLTVAGWSSNQQTVTYTHDTSKRNVIDVFPASVEEWASCGVLAISETAAGITFKCATVPTNALNFAVTAMGVSV